MPSVESEIMVLQNDLKRVLVHQEDCRKQIQSLDDKIDRFLTILHSEELSRVKADNDLEKLMSEKDTALLKKFLAFTTSSLVSIIGYFFFDKKL